MEDKILKMKEIINQKFDNSDSYFSAKYFKMKNSMLFLLDNLLANDLKDVSKLHKKDILSNLKLIETKFKLLV